MELDSGNRVATDMCVMGTRLSEWMHLFVLDSSAWAHANEPSRLLTNSEMPDFIQGLIPKLTLVQKGISGGTITLQCSLYFCLLLWVLLENVV